MIAMRDLKTFCFKFEWPKYVDENLKHKIEFIIKSNRSLAENKIELKIEQLLLKKNIEKKFMNTENSKTNEPHKSALNF